MFSPDYQIGLIFVQTYAAMKKPVFVFLLLLSFAVNANIDITLPDVTVQNTTANVKISNHGTALFSDTILINGEKKYVSIAPGTETHLPVKIKKGLFVVKDSKGKVLFQKEINPIPLWLSVIPPLIAIILALMFKEVFSAIFAGIFSGTFIISLYSGGISWLTALLKGFLLIPDYLTEVLTDADHVSIIIFSMLIGGTVNVISKNGGMKAIIGKLSKYANDRKSGQLISMIMGIVIFFDDYANTLVVGNTMRPLTDKLKISREKLSYIVDSTAAPVVSIAFITTWIGAELSYIKSGLEVLNMNESPYMVFMHSLKYAFYPVFTLIFMYLLIRSGKDFGPMYHAELKAISKNEPVKEDKHQDSVNKHSNMWLAIVPVGIIIFGTLGGLIYTGYSPAVWNSNASWWMKVSETIGNSNSFKALMWASLFSLVAAIGMSIYKKIFDLAKAVEHSLDGFKSMLQAIIILTLAWSLALLTQQLHTADFFTSVFIYLSIPLFLIPAITFVISALISFSTGSSWGTMAILYPIMLPVAWYIAGHHHAGYEYSFHIFYGVAAAIITGSVFGDHCSPISDTTILSSMASGCRHIDHVRTQMPYAVTVATVSLFAGIIPTSLNLPFWMMYIAGIVVLWAIVRFYGKKIEV